MVVKCHQVLPLTETADNVDLAVLCLVICVRADLADTNVLLRLIENLALLPLLNLGQETT